MSPLTESTRLTLAKAWDLSGFDADAAAYIQRVEWADTTPLEGATRTAINNFVVGCKADGIWTSIKASCILAGARTLAGALMPLAGSAPTNFNFVSGDYNRKTGLVGNGSTKYLNSNRNNNADPQNSNHNAVYVTTFGTPLVLFMGLGVTTAETGVNNFGSDATGPFFRNRSSNFTRSGSTAATGLIGTSRNSSTSYQIRIQQSNATATVTSESTFNGSIHVFSISSGAGASNCRLAFYSIGESLDLALLDTRVSALITAFGVAIP